MGSSTSKAKTEIIPTKLNLKNTPVPSSVNGYNYYPTRYMPDQYAYPIYPPIYPENYPVVSNENYIQNESSPQSQARNKVPEQPIPTQYRHVYHSDNANHHLHHHNHHHSLHGHHHHHHHHLHRSPSLTEKERLSPPILIERATSPSPPVHRPHSLQAQKAISPIVTYKIVSPVANKNLITPPPPVHHSSSVVAKRSSNPILTEKPSSSTVMKQHQSPPLITFKSISPPLSTTANSFEKSPIIETFYITKSADNNSMHSYEPIPLSIVQRTLSRPTAPGNRWYDHDYDKRVQPLTVKYV